MRVFLLAALAAVPLTTLPPAVPAFAADAPTQTLRIALREDADMLDPTLARTYVGRIVFAGLCDKLFDIDAKLNIVPQLATGYQWTDSKTLVIKLRDGVTFQDGEKMDAEAVKYSLLRHLNMPGSSRRAEIAGMESIDVIDPLTVRITLKAPNAPFLAALTDRAGMIVSPKAAEAEGKDFALHPVCAGPYKFTERVSQDRIVLDRFPGYWDAAHQHFARVIYQPIVDSSVRLANLRAGAIDLSEQIVPSDVDAVKQDPKLQLVMSPGLGYNSINFNLANGTRADTPLGRDPRVRKAFELSVDRQALVQVVYNGMYDPTAQAVPPASPFYAPGVLPPQRDVAQAKKLLAEAGVKTPVVVHLMLSNQPDIQQLGVVIQSMAAEAGFDVKLDTMEFATSLSAADRGDFQAYVIGWSGRSDPDGNLYSFLHSGGPLNYAHYASKEVDNWLEQARAATDVAARQALYAKVSAQVETDLPIMYLYLPKNIVGMSAKLSGFQPVPDGMIRLTGLKMAP
ncbi:MAG: ABC transporter substrate-binding protein [Rhodospirillales bacterium 70-18]|nr:ABC transporter substrate-binding protein [Rhodospirillales bacterium]OJY73560.1 MAG: ABC transporter substrate-binding protein [Rhodospirillales bacterium 70-18]